MKSIPLLYLLIMLSTLTACSSNDTVISQTATLNPDISAHATIVNIREITLDAKWQHQFAGSVLGLAIGETLGNDELGVAGMFIGGDIANELYGQTVDELTLEDKYGNHFMALVPARSFMLNSQVLFAHTNGKISALQVLQ